MKAKVIRIIIVAVIFSTVAGFTVQSDNTCSQIIAVIASAIVGAVIHTYYSTVYIADLVIGTVPRKPAAALMSLPSVALSSVAVKQLHYVGISS